MCYGPEKTVTTYLKYLETRILPTSCLSCGFEPKEAWYVPPTAIPFSVGVSPKLDSGAGPRNLCFCVLLL